MPSQRLPFELDPQIIHHIIYSQAGSIGKAVIELLMNAVDAEATDVTLTLTRNGFTCQDNGKGFASRDDVLRYFGRFGTPHQEGDATYGRFRLGRGQIMAHASTGFIDYQNMRLVQAGLCPPPPDWEAVLTRGLQAQREATEQQRQAAEQWNEAHKQEAEDYTAWMAEQEEQDVQEKHERQRIAAIVDIPPDAVDDDLLYWMMGADDEAIRQAWAEKPWENAPEQHAAPPVYRYPDDIQALIRPGETALLLTRNAAAAGFMHVKEYLKWRAEDNL
ncbi:TPA: ATP-binding protein [Serratia fonticola]